MSETLSLKESQTLEISSSTGKYASDSNEKLLSENSTININNNNIGNDLKVSIKKSIKYPLTERSKRVMAAKIRTERERKTEQINKINKTITFNAQIIKVDKRIYIVMIRIWISIHF